MYVFELFYATKNYIVVLMIYKMITEWVMAELSLSEKEKALYLRNLSWNIHISVEQSPAYQFFHPVSVLIIFQCYNLLLWENTQLDSEIVSTSNSLIIFPNFIFLYSKYIATAFTIFLFSMFYTIIEDCFYLYFRCSSVLSVSPVIK